MCLGNWKPSLDNDRKKMGVKLTAIKKHYRLGLVILLFSFSSNLLAASNAPLLIFHGGRGSCKYSSHTEGRSPYGMSLYRSFYALHQKLRRHYGKGEIKYLVGCFGYRSPLNEPSLYFTSEDPKTIQVAQPGELPEIVQELMASNPYRPIYIAGHSYGGWRAMRLAERLGHLYDIRGLYTMDPISPVNCGTFQFLTGYKGCKEAPTDLDRERIKENSQIWVNFYQNRDKGLHSSEIEEATNLHLTYKKDPPSKSGACHPYADEDPRVWKIIHRAVFSTLAR